MKTLAGLGGTIALLLAVRAAATQAPPAPPSFAARVEAVRLDVYASRNGHPLSGLGAEDFEVLDNGVPQPATLESAGGPVHAILLLDTSGSVAGPRLEHLRAAAHAFVDGLGAEDQATLLTFSHDVRLASAPSRDRAALHRALDEARAGGGTALNDALFAGLQFADPARGRAVVLVFSDGGDRLSWLDPSRLREAARRTEASVYAVALAEEAPVAGRDSVAYLSETANRPPASGPPRREPPTRILAPSSSARPGGDLPPLLRDLASDTGGQVWRADDGAQLQTLFLQALAEVKSRYLLRFEPAASTPGWHTLEVKLRARKGDVRARKGYFAAAGG
jgi:VWFA-related protein